MRLAVVRARQGGSRVTRCMVKSVNYREEDEGLHEAVAEHCVRRCGVGRLCQPAADTYRARNRFRHVLCAHGCHAGRRQGALRQRRGRLPNRSEPHHGAQRNGRCDVGGAGARTDHGARPGHRCCGLLHRNHRRHHRLERPSRCRTDRRTPADCHRALHGQAWLPQPRPQCARQLLRQHLRPWRHREAAPHRRRHLQRGNAGQGRPLQPAAARRTHGQGPGVRNLQRAVRQRRHLGRALRIRQVPGACAGAHPPFLQFDSVAVVRRQPCERPVRRSLQGQ